MKIFWVSVFLCVFLVVVQSFPLEENAEFEVHEDGVEIHETGDELTSLVRNKRQFNFHAPQPHCSWSWMGGGLALGARGNYDVPEAEDARFTVSISPGPKMPNTTIGLLLLLAIARAFNKFTD